MRYSGIQPQYFPRLHYFARILQTDIFVIRDDVQFVRKHKYPDGKTGKSYQAHSPLKHASGIHHLMIPIIHAGHKSIGTTGIQYEQSWTSEHLKTISNFYSRAPYFATVFPEVEELLQNRYKNLAELNIATILWGVGRLLNHSPLKRHDLSLQKINSLLKDQKKFRLKKILKGSESKTFRKKSVLSANEKIISLLREIGADEDFCGGTAVAAYMDRELFEKEGIKITVQQWTCKEYPQIYNRQQGFIPNLSIIDLFMNVSKEETEKILLAKD